jgi:MOSC domain-containing protein YiiM
VQTRVAGVTLIRLTGSREIAPGDAVHLDQRPNSDFLFTRLVEFISHDNATRLELERMQRMEGLAADWKIWAHDRLSSSAPSP